MPQQMENTGEILIYSGSDHQLQLEVRLEGDTVWLNRNQLAALFGRDVKTIGKHIGNVFKEAELDAHSVVAIFATTATDGKSYQVEHYNLDLIISVGYRVNSKRGTQFRQWATQRLRDYLVKGYAINERQLKASEERFLALKSSLQLLENVVQRQPLTSDEAVSLLKVVAEYAQALDLLDQYDHQRLSIPEMEEAKVKKLEYAEAIAQITLWREQHQAGRLFGNEKDASFRSSLEAIYQTFDGNDLYPTTREKAAHLLYFIVKNHSFSDGNKRIAAGLFVYFLDKNAMLHKADGSKIIADNALVAITMMVAESDPREKEIMTKLIVNLLLTK